MNGTNLLTGLSFIDQRFIEESENDIPFEKGSSPGSDAVTKKRSRKIPPLIAAIIVLMLIMMGCTLAVLRLNDLKLGEKTYTHYSDDSTTQKTKELFSIQGAPESNSHKAAKEWYEFLQSYDLDKALLNEGDSFSKPDGYDSYLVYNQEMVDKVDDICRKYDLKLTGSSALFPVQAHSRMKEILGFDSILKEGQKEAAIYTGGLIYECGNFDLHFRIRSSSFGEVFVGYYYADKIYFSTTCLAIYEPKSVQEWNYTTTDGTELLLVKDAEYAWILCDREDAFLVIQLGGKLQEVPDITREEMETIAEILNFDLKSQKLENMDALAAELEEFYR